ncbi:hypothetical protein [Enterococcus sp. AZ163]|uniref:hypothetical protein n=1 Tax=Enterococcus sp. AZ163 TaxID=2774638 RepID=UPI003D290B75
MKKLSYLLSICLIFFIPIKTAAEETIESPETSSTVASSQTTTESTNETTDETTEATTNSSQSSGSSSEEATNESVDTLESEELPRMERSATTYSEVTVPEGYHLYAITNYASFKSAMADTTYKKKYLLLQTDIVYGYVNLAIDTLTFNADTIIDGGGTDGTHQYGMFFGYTSNDANFNTSTLLKVSSANLNITFRNLSFGSNAYPNSTTAGLVYPYTNGSSFAANLNLTIENVNYTISGNGAVPFNGYYGTGSTITFKGTNSFISSSTGNYGREFASGFRWIIFDAASTNYIKVMSNPNGEDAVFRGESEKGPIDVSLNQNAQVTIDNGKNDLFASSIATLNVGENAQFHYKTINGGGLRGTSYMNSGIRNVSDGGPTTLNVGKNAEVLFENNKSVSTSWSLKGNTVVNADDPKRILFSKTNAGTNLFTGGTMTFNRKDADAFRKGQINTLINGATEAANPKLLDINQSASYTENNTANQVTLLYQPTAKVASVSATTKVAPKQSDLILGESLIPTPTDRTLQETTYKVATADLVADQNPNSESSQAAIEMASGNTLKANQSLTGQTQFTINQLVAQTYYLYTKIKDQITLTASGRTFTVGTTSNWLSTTQTVEPGIFVQLPVQAAFTSPMTGAFKSTSYDAINLGNTPILVSATALTDSTNNQFKLVDQLTNNSSFEATLNLELAASYNAQKELVSLTNIDTRKGVTLQPFSETGSKGSFTLKGDYSGPLSGVKSSNYLLQFSIQAAN